MNVLVDTSVWVNHFKYGNPHLIQLLEQDFAITHPMVLLELACGTPPAPRSKTLNDIGQLRYSEQATFTEVATWVEQQQLYGLGCGLVDLSLLAATQLTPQTKLWTLDKRLQQVAIRFDLAYLGESLEKIVPFQQKKDDLNIFAIWESDQNNLPIDETVGTMRKGRKF